MRFWPGTRLTRLGAKRRKATWSLRGSGQNPKCERCWGMLRHNEQPVSTCDVGAQLPSAIAADRAKRQLGGLHFVAPWQHGRGTESMEKNIIRTWHIAMKQIFSQEPANAPCEFYGDSSVPHPILHRRPGPQSSPPIWGSAWHCDRRWALASHWGTNLAETPFFCIQLNSWSKDRPGSRQKCQLVLCPKALPSKGPFFSPSLPVHVGSDTGRWYGSRRRLRHWIAPGSDKAGQSRAPPFLLGRSGTHFSPRWTLIDYSLQVAVGRFAFYQVSNSTIGRQFRKII